MLTRTKRRNYYKHRRHLGAFGILVIVLAVLGVSAVGSLQLEHKNRSYEAREKALEESILSEQERAEGCFIITDRIFRWSLSSGSM